MVSGGCLILGGWDYKCLKFVKKMFLVVDHHFDMAQHVYTLFSGLYTRLLYTSLYILVMVANKKSTDCMKKVMLNQIYEQKPMLKPIKLWTPIASHGLENNEHHVQNWGPILTVSQSHFWFIRST